MFPNTPVKFLTRIYIIISIPPLHYFTKVTTKILLCFPSRSSQETKDTLQEFHWKRCGQVWRKQQGDGEATGTKGRKLISPPELTRGATWQNTATAQTLTGKGEDMYTLGSLILSSDLPLTPSIGQTQPEARAWGVLMKRFWKSSFLQHREGGKMHP